MKTEEPYFDSNGREIKEFAVLKMFHFTGRNEQGRGRKHYYMYKWARLEERNGEMWWAGHHLTSSDGKFFYLRSCADKETRVIADMEIVQQY